MAIPRVKATYSFDPATVRLLERISRRWGVPKSEALRRVIRAAAAHTLRGEPDMSATPLDRLQEAAGVSASVAAAWARHARTQRRANSRVGA